MILHMNYESRTSNAPLWKQNEGERDFGEKFVAIVSTQAICLLKLGDFITAKKFAEEVLMRTTSAEAQYVKAESLYNLCEFEHALVTFYKGQKSTKKICKFHL